jgi:hypothetical protein
VRDSSPWSTPIVVIATMIGRPVAANRAIAARSGEPGSGRRSDRRRQGSGGARQVLAGADRVGLADPAGELLIHLLRGADPEVVHEQTLRVRRDVGDARILDGALQVEIARRPVASGPAPANPRRLPLKVIDVLDTA